ncbi:CocE/NonD family hydrolase [Peristeroidobacter soli]|jgi:putative CocE/NonD family hydrolase|uniref:CocE/NonD family hydrolase n=1 Tax=Peristeroidobacter soli TaxID=2497877 RepID=UPI00101BA5BE|nr:CocE/NonD family hydrolase [Peristeroidobacter soli]
MPKFLCAALASLVAMLAFTAPSAAREEVSPYDGSAVIVEHNVMVPMRDGVRLATDVYRPAAEGKYPVILTRDPYDNGSDDNSVAEGHAWAKRGYVFLHQDVRGRYDSEGSFYTYSSEVADGYDAQQWAGSQPWSSGKVGMLGGSYLASAQWLSAHLRAPALVAIAPRMTPYNYYKDVAYPGGALSLSSRIDWAALMAGHTNQTRNYDWNRVLRHLPLTTMDRALGRDMPHWRDWIAHPSYDSFWKALDVESRASEMDVPAYSIAGWYDVFLRGNLTSFADMRTKARSERARKNQKLIIGPWPHAEFPTQKLGDLDFGADSVVKFETLHQRWFDYWLKGENTGVTSEAPVRLFVMGENRWRDEQEWPLARTQYTKFYLRSAGKANGRDGNGRLERAAPGASEPTDNYVYDPENPVPTIGGNLMFKPLPAGPFDQSALDGRDDVLMFVTAPLDKELEVTGPILVTLYAASTARDTDFTAKLLDVHPDGKAYNLADGIIRARYRKSFEQESLIEPGAVNEYTIDLWATSNVFKKGHRIRIDVSSSNFPRFDRNPNTGKPFGTDTSTQPATQTIYHNKRYPSHVTLPLIPR